MRIIKKVLSNVNKRLELSSKPKVSKKTGNEFIRFKVPAKLNTTKNIDAEVKKIAVKIDTESKAYVGVPLSVFFVTSKGNFDLQKVFYFKSSDGNVCKAYATDTESATGFSIVIAKLTKKKFKRCKTFNPASLSAVARGATYS